MMSAPRWRIALFGPLQATNGTRTLTSFGGEKARALLAYLLLAPHAHSREKLVALFWPEVPPEAGNRRLRNALYDLRCTFAPDDILKSDRQLVQIATDRVIVNPELLLGEGEPLEGIYEDWATPERERLLRLREKQSPSPLTAPLLPVLPNRFVGRIREREQLTALLESHSLVTITGQGGSGKTHLALELARRWPDPCWFVSLTDQEHPEQLADALREALALPVTPGSSPRRALREWLACQPKGLVLLDGAEHILPAQDPSLLALRQGAPHLRLLVTSRQTLELPGEAEFPLDPLSHEESLSLFVDRARLVRPAFEADGATHTLCQRLEGFPLALELAAAWMGILTPEQLLERLKQTARLPTLPPSRWSRHASLEQVFHHSFAALPPVLQQKLPALAFFRGGWTQEAAEAIAEVTLQEMETLRRHSWIRLDSPSGAGMRGSMQEILRQWAEQLLPPELGDSLVHRFIAYFATTLEDQGLHPYAVSSAQASRALRWCEQEQDNLRHALALSRESQQAPVRAFGCQLAVQLAPFWYIRGALHEGRDALQAACALATHPSERALAEVSLSWFCRALGERDEALALATSARAALPESHPSLALSWYRCGQLFSDLADYEQAAHCYREARTRWEAQGEELGRAMTLHNTAQDHFRRGHLAQAKTEAETSLGLFAQFEDDWWMARLLNLLTGIEIERGDYTQALRHGHESERLHRRLSSLRGIAQARRDQGQAHFYAGEFEPAALLGQEALALFQEIGDESGAATTQATLAIATLFRRHPGDLERAQQLLESAERFCSQGKRAGLQNYVSLFKAELARQQGKSPTPFLEQALQGFRQAQEKVQIALCLELLAEATGVPDGLEEAATLRQGTGAPSPGFFLERWQRLFP
jgi:predicted ATPase